jgi:NAD(P)-dependent dehydrogenase (short-subunit alcohol dehydrogenase family)
MADRFSLKGKCCLITGASSGFGEHFARVCAAAGATIVIGARRIDRLAALKTELEVKGASVLAVALDVRSRESVVGCYDAIEKAGLIADVIVNNAGVSLTTPFLNLTEELWDDVAGTNLNGAWRVAHEGAKRLQKHGRPGSIINIASITAIRASGAIAPYAAAKAGLIQLTKVMALELARYNIRTNALAPGWFSTELNDGFLKSILGDNLRKRIPQRRFGNVEELDGPLLLLASDASSYMNGSTIVIDGESFSRRNTR